MPPTDDWADLGQTWRSREAGEPTSPPALDEAAVQDLARAVARRRRRIFLVVGLELACTFGATAFLARWLIHPATAPFPAAQSWWVWVVLALCWVMQGALLYLRRGQWRVPTMVVDDLLALVASRARAAIRLVWLNLAGLGALVVLSLPLFLPTPRDPTRYDKVVLMGRLGVACVLISVVISALVWRRAHRTLRTIAQLKERLRA